MKDQEYNLIDYIPYHGYTIYRYGELDVNGDFEVKAHIVRKAGYFKDLFEGKTIKECKAFINKTEEHNYNFFQRRYSKIYELLKAHKIPRKEWKRYRELRYLGKEDASRIAPILSDNKMFIENLIKLIEESW